MKIFLFPAKSQRGNTLVLTIVVTGLVGFLLASYMGLVKSQNIATMRSQSWNATIPVIEAGLEEALTHINVQLTNDLAVNGWTLHGTLWGTKRWVGSNYYTVTISNWVVGSPTNNPVIESRGYVIAPVTMASIDGPVFATAGGTAPTRGHVARGIRCMTRTDALFSKGLVAKGQIDMKGNNISADSFNSQSTNWSTGGKYDINKRKAGGAIATNSGLTNSLSIGNADIFGKVSTGPGGSISIGPNGVVGDIAWNTNSANQGKIKPGWATDDMNVDFVDAKVPPLGTTFSLSSGNVGGTNYTYLLRTDNYQAVSLSMSGNSTMMVTGKAKLHIIGNLSLSGNAKIIIAPGGSLELYVGGPGVSFGGNGVANQNGNPLTFSFYGLPTCTSVDLNGNGTFVGTMYAPNAALTLNGGGSGGEDFSGAAIVKTATMNGHFKFHYDEALQVIGPPRGYIVTRWDEMSPQEVAAGPSL